MRLPASSFVARRLAAWLLSAFVAFLAVPAYAQTEVPSDWPLKPSGLNVGEEFRLMFMGKNSRAADSTDIAVYDAYVQGRIAAIGHSEIKAYASHFKVLGSTAAVNARTHTGTTGTAGIPIYWLNGQKVADNYGDFYDGSWTNALSARLEDGTVITQNRRDQVICTGTADDGTTDQPLGAASCTATTIGDTDHTLSGTTHLSTAESRYLVLSGVFRVGNFTSPTIPVVESVAVTSDPGSDGEYVKDDAIKVTVTFSEAVAVTGTPKIKMRLVEGAMTVKPRYVAADSTATALVFSYTVKATDYSHDGVIFPRNGIVLGNGGAIKNQAGAVDADLDYAAIEPRSGHKIHVRPEVDSVTVASTPASGTSYATGETIQIDLTFDRKVSVFTGGGTPTLGVVIGTTTRQAAYTTTVGDDVVRFEYVVQASDSDPDGIQVNNHAITWNGGFIIRQEHGDVADKASLLVRANGDTMGTTPFSGHGVNAVDVLGVDVDPTSLPVAEGGNDYYSVFLTAQPSGTVTVTPSVTGSSDVTVNPASLTFTTVNWSVSQDVTVSAAQDADADADTATIEHTVSGADYGSVVADDVAVTVTEDDKVSTKVTLTVSAPTLAESAGPTEVTVTGELNGVPVSTATVVTVSMGASADTATEGTDYTAVSDLTLTIPANLTSATANFELTPVNDDVDEVDEALTVDGTVQGLTVTPATVTITDDDTRGVNVSRTTLPVAEGGSDTYTVVLTSEPTGQVTMTPSVADNFDVTVRPTSLTFTSLDWSTAQTVTVEAAHDADAEVDAATIEHAVSGGDYGSVNAADVVVTVTEDERASSKVTLTVSTPTVAEDAGATQVTVTAELDAVPRASATVVTVSVGATGEPATEGTDYIAVNDFSLTIPADQTSATADFTLTPVDDGFVEVDETLSVDGTAQGLTVTPATMTITDNDTLSLVLSAPSLSVLEGARSTYTLVLGSQPTATVTVDITGATGTDLTLDKTSLTFTAMNWNVPQTVRVTAAQDNTDSFDDEVTLTHTASGGNYASLGVDLAVTVEDNDAASIYAGGVTVVSSPLNSSNAYGRGETIRIQAAFNVAVVVDTSGGTPAIQVNFGSARNVGVTKEFEYARGSGSSRLEFEYEVQQGDVDGDGLDLVDNGLVLNGATIKDTRSGQDAVLLYTGGIQDGHLVVGSSVPDPIEITSLALSGITLSPAFATTETSYSASVGYDVFETTVTAVATAGSVSILPADAGSTSGHQVALATGANEITITASQNGITSPTYTVTVTRAPTSVSIAAGASSATYRLEDVDFTVTRAETSGQALDVDLTISQDQSFLAASKLTPTVTIPANRASAKLTLQPSDFSSSVSADGRLTATVQDGDEFDLGSPASASIDFVVADPAVIVRLEQSSYSFLENAGTVTVNVVAETAAGVPQPTSLSIGPLLARRSAETAVHGQDFTFSVTTMTFRASDYVASGGRFVATKALSLPLINDTVSEDDETLSIVLQLASGQLPSLVDLTQADGSPCGGQCSSQVTIIDDDSPPAQVTGVEVTPGQSALTVDWTAVLGATGYKVQWKSGMESFADAATDSREAIVSSGSTTSHSITGLTDGTLYTVRVIATRSGAPSDGAASSEVTGTPGTPTLTIADASATEGSAVEFTVTLSPAAATDVTVEYATTDGTATSDSSDPDGADYTAPTSGAELTISAGSTSATISIATGNDTVDEDDETFTVTLSSPSSNAALGADKTATGTIEDDDVDAAQVTNAAFTNAPSDGMYGLGDVIEVSVTFDAAVDVTGSPRIALQLPGAPAADRYALYDDSASSDTVLVFRKTVTAAVDDMDGTGVAADALELNGGGIVNKDTTVAAVLDHDALSGGNIRTRIISGIEITSDPSVATPAGYYGGGETVEFTASFSQAVTVSGTPQLKFIASDQGRQTAAYASGTGSAELVFTWTVPADVPGGETPIEIPSNIGTGGALLTDGGLVLTGGTIQDSSARDVNIRHGQYTTDSEADTTGPALVAGAEGATVAGTQLVLTFERNAGVAEYLDENSVPATSDFAVVVQSVGRTVSAVAVSGATVTLTLSEPMGHAQTVTVRYTPGANPIKDLWGNSAPGFSSRAVRNDSPEPELSVADVMVDEGDGTAEFTVTLDVASGETVTVGYATSNGTAEAGSDYTAKSGTLTIAAGQTSKDIEVVLADDSLSEADEDFTLTLSNASNAGIDVGTATATITDNESTPTLTIADATATEGGAVSFTVTLDPASSSDVTVGYATANGTATSDSSDPDGADYTAPTSGAELTISAEQTSATISIATGNDTVDEDDETFTLTLSGQSSNAVLGAAKTATGTIEDDDTSPAVITNLRFTNKPADGIYNFREVIEVSVTFDQDVEVTGTPQIKITQLIGHYHYIYADYDAAASTDRVLVFRLLVTGDIDDSSNGLRIGANRLQLNGGSIRNKGTTVGANRSHDEVLSDLDVRTRFISDMQITSDSTVATPAGFYGPGETVEFTVTFSRSVKVKTDSGVPALFFRASDSGLQQAAYASGSESSSLVFAWTVPADVPGAEDTIKIPTNIGSGVTLLTDAGLVLNGGIIQALGSVANIRHGQYTTSSQADTTGPALAAGAQGATVNGTELELTFERKAGVAEHLDETSVPAASDFSVLVQSVARTVSAVAVNGATVTLTLSDPVGHAQTVTVGYTLGAGPLKDVWGNDAPGFSSRAVRNDSPEPELSVADVMVDEGDGTAEFTVTLDVASGETVTVGYATSNGTAEAGSDYTAKSGTLTIAAGQTSKDIEVVLADDSLSEADEDFTLTLSNSSNAGIDVGTATATITDNESTPTLTIADATATEGGAVSFTVTLDPASSSDVTVEYATTDGTATADSADPDGADYTAPASGAELTISASQTSGTISIATGDDAVFEADETFTVTLASPSSNAVLGTQKTATGTIENNDAASTDTALKALMITAAGSEVTLLPTFAVEEHNYRASVDNTVASVSVAAEANHRKATVAIIEGTDLAFGENTLTLRVTAEDGITTQDYTVTVTRALPELTWESQSTLSLDEDAGAVELTVTLTPASSDQVTVDYTTLAAGAVEGEDYTQASGTLTFAAGETQKTITVTILDDTLYEPDSVDGILVELSNDSGTAVLGRTTVYLQIQDNDSPPAATMENVTVDEGAGTMVFTLSLAHGIDTDIEYRANANEVGGTANEGIDYSPFIPGTGVVKLEIPARQTSATFVVTILDDDVHEADETISIHWSENSGHVATASIDVMGTINDDDERGVVVTPTTLSVPEAGSGSYTVVLTSQPTGTVTVTPSVGGNSEVTVAPSPLTFTAGTWSTAQTVTVSAAADTDAVNDTATVTHAVSGGDYGTETASDVSVTVTDDETVSTGVVLSVDPSTVSEDAGATVVTVTGTLNHAPRLADTVVTLTVGDADDAAVEGTDYGTVGSLTLTIAAGSASGTKTFTLTPADDDAAGADRALTVAGSVTGLDVTAAAVTIEDDDERGVVVTPTTLSVPEAGSGSYTVVLTSQPTGTVTVTPSVGGNSEVTVAPSPLTFTAGTWSTAQTVTVSAAADTDAVNDTATVTHAVSGGDYGTETASDVSVTVTDDETVSTGVVLSVDPSTVSEDAGATVVTVTGTLNHAPRLADTVVTLTVGDADDAAVEGTDYGTVGSLTLTIAAGSASGTKTFTLTPADDDAAGADRALTVAGSVTGLDVTAAAVTIEDDDERGVVVTPTTLSVPEAGSGSYTVVLTSQPTGTVTVTPSVGGNSEVTVAPSPLTFTAGTWSTAQTVTVSAAADTDAVNDTATVTHAVSGGDYGTETASDVSVTVTDDETVSTGVVLSVDPSTVSEDAGATVVTVTGTLNHAPRLADTVVTLTVGDADDAAVEGTDYGTVGSLTLTIAAGSASGTKTFTLTPADDDAAGADRALTVAGSVTGLDVTAAAVTIEDDDERGVVVTPTTLSVPEAGSGSYTVVLTSQPTGTVTVTPSVGGNSEVTVAPSPLTFTAGTWSTAQTVTVSAAADTDAVNDTATVTHAVSGGDYGTETASDVSVTVTDDETVSTGVVLSVDPSTVSEDAGATVVTVTGTLNHAPRLADTVVTLTVGDADDAAVEGTDYGTVGSLTLTIAAGSASGTKTFTLTPADDDAAGADRALTVAGSVTGLDVTAAAVTIEDDDERGVVVTPTTLSVPEAGSGSYTVVLTSQPTGTVTVTPSVGGNSEVTVAPSPLTFTAGTWSTAQTVTVSAAADTDAVNDTATVTHAVSGGDYGTETASDVSVTVTDDETVSTGVVLSVDPSTVSRGDGCDGDGDAEPRATPGGHGCDVDGGRCRRRRGGGDGLRDGREPHADDRCGVGVGDEDVHADACGRRCGRGGQGADGCRQRDGAGCDGCGGDHRG